MKNNLFLSRDGPEILAKGIMFDPKQDQNEFFENSKISFKMFPLSLKSTNGFNSFQLISFFELKN
jgi:hypothetical protein